MTHICSVGMTTNRLLCPCPASCLPAMLSAIRAAWSIDTTFTPEQWKPANPARGQCAATAVVLAELLHPDAWLMRGWVTEPGSAAPVRHYWIEFDSCVTVDPTWCQFAVGSVVTGVEPTTAADIEADDWMRERVQALRVAVAERR